MPLTADGQVNSSARALAAALRPASSTASRTRTASANSIGSSATAAPQDGRMISLPEWHRGGLRDLCFELFGQRSTRAVRFVMSSALRQLGTPVG